MLTTMSTPLATFEFAPGKLAEALEFLKRTRWELRQLRRVHVWKDKLQVFDVNKDFFEVRGVVYADADVVPLLRMGNAAFDPQAVHEATDTECKEFDTGRRHAWAEDRVM